MPLHPTAIRRISILILGLLIVIGGVSGLWFYQQSRRDVRAENNLVKGLAHFEKAQYKRALPYLSKYINRNPDDLQTLYTYAKVRLHVPEPGNRHIGQAIRTLHRVLEIEPNHIEAIEDLLGLYTSLSRDADALEFADRLLLLVPGHRAATRSKAVVLSRLRRYEQALDVANDAIEQDPVDFEMQLLALEMRSQLGESDKQLLLRADALARQHAQDGRFELLRAFASYLAGQYPQMVEQLKQAAKQDPPNTKYVVTLVRFLDATQLYGDSLLALGKAAASLQDSRLNNELARRLIEAQRPDEALAYFDPQQLLADNIDEGFLALHAIALYEASQRDQADKVVQRLANQSHNVSANAWATVLEAVYGQTAIEGNRIIGACQKALVHRPTAPYLHYFLAEGYAAVGELELALHEWKIAADLRPNWAKPRIGQVRPLINLGQNTKALQQARGAMICLPNNTASAAAWALARAANLGTGGADSAQEVLHVIDQIQRVAPGEEQTLLLRVALLEQLDQPEQIRQTIKAALQRQPPLSQLALLNLARYSRKLQLDMEAALFEQVRQAYGFTPHLALAMALQEAQNDDPAKGLELVKLPDDVQDSQIQKQWRISRCRYLEAINHDQAGGAWGELADHYADDSLIQQLAISAASTKTNRQLADRIINRLRELSGQGSLTWKTERARWFLDQAASPYEAQKAIELLNQVLREAPAKIDVRLLLAQAQEKLGRIPLAINQLRIVARYRPQWSAVTLELARLHQAIRAFASARQQLLVLVNTPRIDRAMLLQAARMLARQGDDAPAIEVLEKLRRSESGLSPNDLVLLASLQERNDSPQQAKALIGPIMATPSAAGIAWVAHWYAVQGDPQQAARVLDELQNLDLDSAQRQLILAEHASRLGLLQEAVEHYLAGVTAAPNRAALWRSLVGHYVMLGQSQAAIENAYKALESVPDDQALGYFYEQADLVTAFASRDRYRPLVLALLTNQPDRSAAAEALEIIAQAQAGGDKATGAQVRLHALAERHTGLLCLQNIAAWEYLRSGRPQQAAAIATRATDAFPTATEPAWLAAQAFSTTEQWGQALIAARTWFSRASSDRLSAAMKIAQCQLKLSQARQAQQTLEPWLEEALANPQTFNQVIIRYGQALVLAGQVEQAEQLFEPLLGDFGLLRLSAMRLAVLASSDQQRAAAWLTRIAKHVGAEDQEQRIALAQSWWSLGVGADNAQARQTARSIIEQAIATPQASAVAWFLAGVMAEDDGQLAVAGKHYQAAISRAPNMHEAKNNLAMVITQQHGDLDKAMELARQAIQESKPNANYLDTLALIQVQRQEFEQAIATMEQAMDLDPGNPKWKKKLAVIRKNSEVRSQKSE